MHVLRLPPRPRLKMTLYSNFVSVFMLFAQPRFGKICFGIRSHGRKIATFVMHYLHVVGLSCTHHMHCVTPLNDRQFTHAHRLHEPNFHSSPIFCCCSFGFKLPLFICDKYMHSTATKPSFASKILGPTLVVCFWKRKDKKNLAHISAFSQIANQTFMEKNVCACVVWYKGCISRPATHGCCCPLLSRGDCMDCTFRFFGSHFGMKFKYSFNYTFKMSWISLPVWMNFYIKSECIHCAKCVYVWCWRGQRRVKGKWWQAKIFNISGVFKNIIHAHHARYST